MTFTIIGLIVLGLAILCFLAALISIGGALQSRAQSTRITYGVGRQHARRSMQVALLRAALFAIVGLVLLGVYGLIRRPPDTVAGRPTSTATRAVQTTRASATLSATMLPSVTPFSVPSASPTGALLPSSTVAPLSPTALPTPTETPLPSAVVSSEVGLYLREAPGGIQELELLPVGTILVLLPGRTTLEGVEWQQVRTPSGLEGWVAVEFITYQ